MIVAVLALLAVLAVPLTGGSFQRLGQVPIRAWWLLPLALILQVLVITVLTDLPERLAAGIHLATYGLAGLFLWLNRAIRGVPLLAAGAVLNGVTIAVNGGTLPASEWAVRTAGLEGKEGFTNSGVLENPRLLWLGDVFAIPEGLPLANVFSIGDVLIVAGVAVLVVVNSRERKPVETHF
ncbi:hypothetical protein Kisp01_62400 [Kineosporia sp. NBRC 101677]|uniref:DUF5317 domain-containing protein n=1 Tax=Kineosporia sp. NBRC 101677 TaxID=3032197 RepID=UPI0024A131CA|nr:DUF5317 domain-containing protein [Kineosporia sp. NBRC 101677]GLY19226.1 hypothetical protein Kisp01_62400 [Kineosporia sp. NBRC 101677]